MLHHKEKNIRLGKFDSARKISQASRLTRVAADAGAMPRTACNLVIGKGFGQPRQRG